MSDLLWSLAGVPSGWARGLHGCSVVRGVPAETARRLPDMGVEERAARQLRAVAEMVDDGELAATSRQRAFLVGAAEALDAVADPQMSTAEKMSTDQSK